MRRTLSLATLVLGVVAATVSVVTAMPASAADPVMFEWTDASGDHLWSNPANWSNEGGATGTPGPDDQAWGGGSDSGPLIIDVPVTVALFIFDRPMDGSIDVLVEQPMVSSGEWWAFGDVEIRADVTAPKVVLAENVAIIDSTVRVSAHTDLAGRPSIGMAGRIELRGSGALISEVSDGVDVDFLGHEDRLATEIVGVPTFLNPTIATMERSDPTATVELIGRTTVLGGVPRRLELRLRPDDDGVVSITGERSPTRNGEIFNIGTIDVDARSGAQAGRAIVLGRLLNLGTVRLTGSVELAAGFDNAGEIHLADATLTATTPPSGREHSNRGQITLEGGSAMLVFGPFVNDGRIDRIADADGTLFGLLLLRNGSYTGTGGGTAWFANGHTMTPGIDIPDRTPVAIGQFSQASESRLRLRVDGTDPEQIQRLDITGLAELDGTLAVVLGSYALCPGTTVELMRWGSSTGSFAAVEAEGGPDWLTLEPIVSGTGLSVRFGGTPTDGPCADPHDVFVRQLYLDVLGRPVDAGALRYWGDKLRAGATRTQVASAVTASGEYRRRQVADEYQRFLGRRPDAGGLRHWADQLAAGRSMDSFRALLAGSAELWHKAGATPGGFADTLYRTVLGRAADPGGRAYVIDQLAAGRSRGALASGYTHSREADRYQVQLFFAQLLQRPPTADESRAWRARLGVTTEARVVAEITGSPAYVDQR